MYVLKINDDDDVGNHLNVVLFTLGTIFLGVSYYLKQDSCEIKQEIFKT